MHPHPSPKCTPSTTLPFTQVPHRQPLSSLSTSPIMFDIVIQNDVYKTPSSPIHKRCAMKPNVCRLDHLTALPHGLNSGSVLLPGDNVEAFRTLRRREFRIFKPRNIEEALCVETI